MSGVQMMVLAGAGRTVNFTDLTGLNEIYAGRVAATATAGYRINPSTGYADKNINGTYSQIEQWSFPISEAINYEVKATVLAGTVDSGTTGSFLTTTASREWQKVQSVNGIDTVQLQFEIREAGGSTILDTWYVTLTAEREP